MSRSSQPGGYAGGEVFGVRGGEEEAGVAAAEVDEDGEGCLEEGGGGGCSVDPLGLEPAPNPYGTERHAPVSESGLAYGVFAPLWGILELAAVTAAGARPLRTVSLADFVDAHRGELDGVLEAVRAVGDFSADSMAVFERQGGWNTGREVTPECLLMYSGCIES